MGADRYRPRRAGLGHPGLPGPYPPWGGSRVGNGRTTRPPTLPTGPSRTGYPDPGPPSLPPPCGECAPEVLARAVMRERTVCRPSPGRPLAADLRKPQTTCAYPVCALPVAGPEPRNPNRKRAYGGCHARARFALPFSGAGEAKPKPQACAFWLSCACPRFVIGFATPSPWCLGWDFKPQARKRKKTRMWVPVLRWAGGAPPETADGTRAFLGHRASRTPIFHLPFKVRIRLRRSTFLGSPLVFRVPPYVGAHSRVWNTIPILGLTRTPSSCSNSGSYTRIKNDKWSR